MGATAKTRADTLLAEIRRRRLNVQPIYCQQRGFSASESTVCTRRKLSSSCAVQFVCPSPRCPGGTLSRPNGSPVGRTGAVFFAPFRYYASGLSPRGRAFFRLPAQ